MTSCWFTMKQPFANIFLCLLLIMSSTSRVFSVEFNKTFQEVDDVEKMKLIRKYLLKMNKPAEKTIKSRDGDLIDCILFHNQPAFDHPLLRGKIPTKLPRRSHEFNPTKSFQLWNANGEKCPEGTIPIRKIAEEEVLKAASLERFGMKPDEDQSRNEYAFGVVGRGRYFGGSVAINTWSPEVLVKTEYSSSKILISSSNESVSSIEAGWMVYPNLYGDNKPRLFISWIVVNSYGEFGCYNLLCSGFVHTNPNIPLGIFVQPLSTFGGDQYQYTVSIMKDQATGNWILYGQKSEIGYWPSELLPDLRDYAPYVFFGGEVINRDPGGAHTKTQMGSGHFPSEGFRRAAYMGSIQVFNQDGSPASMSDFRTSVSDPDCYNAYIPPPDHDPQLGVHILYGGPGQGPSCP